MHITRYTDYALRVLIYLGTKGDELSTIKEIANRFQISKNHLMRVVHDLQLKGYVETIRGKNGGLRLRLRPEDVNIGRVVRDMEPNLTLAECFGTGNACLITPACELKHVLYRALQAFLGVLDDCTLSDLLAQQRPDLARLLSLPRVVVTAAS